MALWKGLKLDFKRPEKKHFLNARTRILNEWPMHLKASNVFVPAPVPGRPHAPARQQPVGRVPAQGEGGGMKTEKREQSLVSKKIIWVIWMWNNDCCKWGWMLNNDCIKQKWVLLNGHWSTFCLFFYFVKGGVRYSACIYSVFVCTSIWWKVPINLRQVSKKSEFKEFNVEQRLFSVKVTVVQHYSSLDKNVA